jgi:S1-C subfamily serine protease
MKALARQHKCIYTRYADDITFSSFVKHFPKTLATFQSDETGGSLQLGSTLVDLVHANGFSVNEKKTRLQHFSGRQEVTGLTVNRIPNVPQEFVRQVRAMLFVWQKFGPKAAADHFFADHDFKHRVPSEKIEMYGRVVKGKIDYIGMVRGKDSRAHLKLLSKYAALNAAYKWPKQLPPRELDLSVLQEGLYAIETEDRQGTAFRLRGFGLITCAHVVVDQQEMVVKRHGGDPGKRVSVQCLDEDLDLAILRYDNQGDDAGPEFDASLGSVAREDQIVLLGYPTVGPAVSYIIERGAVTGEYTRFGQHRYSVSCTILHGNSGGPILDRNYRLIGIAANGKSRLAKKGDELYGVIPVASLEALRSKCAPSAVTTLSPLGIWGQT